MDAAIDSAIRELVPSPPSVRYDSRNSTASLIPVGSDANESIEPSNQSIVEHASRIQSRPSLCPGIQHKKLSLHGQDATNRPFCLDRWAFIRGEWHSHDCLFVLDPESVKKRCNKCQSTYSNICPSRFPQLYPERAVASAAPELEPQTIDANKLMFQDQNALRLRMHKLIQSAGYDVDLSADAEIAFVSKALKLNGQHTFDINDDQVFVTCVGEGCNSCFLKRKWANVSMSCKKMH